MLHARSELSVGRASSWCTPTPLSVSPEVREGERIEEREIERNEDDQRSKRNEKEALTNSSRE